MKSPWICEILLPNPPPTSGAITRSRSSGTPVTSDMMKRTMCGFCVVFHSVSSPVAGENCATAPRGSIAVGISRCWMIRSRTTTSALLNAASMSPPATVQWNAWLPGASGCSCGAPGSVAALRIHDRRQRLVVDVDQVDRVVGLVRRLGDDDGDRVADVAHDVLASDGIGRGLQPRVRQEPRARDRLQRAVRHPRR